MRLSIIAALLIAGSAVHAAAQDAIVVPATAGWQHAQTGLIFRPEIAGLPRNKIKDSGKSELDVSIDYSNASATLTVFVFRPALGNVPVWFDRSETQIFKGAFLGGAAPQGAPIAFAPPRGTMLSALRRTYVPKNPKVRSTGLVIMPLGEWLVALRMSSDQLDPAALDAKLDAAIAGIRWPEGVRDSPTAVPVPACSTRLAFSKKAKLKKPDMGDALMGAAIMGVVAEKVAKGEEGTPIDFCREGEPTIEYGVYRDKRSTNSYTMALGDAGMTIAVSKGFPLDGKGESYMLMLGALDRTLVYPSFDRLPTPELAYQAVQRSAPISSATRGSKNITIGMPSK